MNTEQLEDLFREGFTFTGMAHDQAVIDKFVLYLQEVMKWNEKTNLTGHKREEEMIGNLFIDSMVGTRVLSTGTACSILDIGTGAGFPGIPIGIVFPQHNVTLLEPNLKKVAFLHHIIGSLGLENACVEPCPIDQFSERPEFHEKFDWAFMKALRFDVGLAYVTQVLSASGKCVCFRTDALPPDCVPKGFSVVHDVPYELPFGLGKRKLSIVGKGDSSLRSE